MLSELLLQSGNDIPFNKARIAIHQPRIKEIAYIGEEKFFVGSHFLMFDKNFYLSDEDKNGLEDKSNFHIFMTVMNSSDGASHKTDAIMVLTLLFPEYKVEIKKDSILLQSENFSSSINEENFEDFKVIINQMFCLKGEAGEEEFNPADPVANKIAEKIKKGKMKKAQTGTDKEMPKINLLSNYISILSVGLGKDKNELMNYTVYQLKDEFKRFQLRESYDLYVKASLAGAQDLEEVENWMEDIHP